MALRKKRWPICKILSNATEYRFQEVFCFRLSRWHFGDLTVKFAPNPIVAYKMASFQNTVTGLLFTVFRWSICAYHVRNILESLLWNFYLTKNTNHKMVSLENIVTRLRIIVFCYSYSAYHQNQTLELLPWNCQLTPLWHERYPICKILSHASKLWFSFT